MHELGMSSKKPYKKSARVVGEVKCFFFFSAHSDVLVCVVLSDVCGVCLQVLGKFHPHGDTAVYDSLVRMAQVIYNKMSESPHMECCCCLGFK